jgi:hypothetical protein
MKKYTVTLTEDQLETLLEGLDARDENAKEAHKYGDYTGEEYDEINARQASARAALNAAAEVTEDAPPAVDAAPAPAALDIGEILTGADSNDGGRDYCMTIERSLTRGFWFKAASDEDSEDIAEKIAEYAKEHPDEMEDSGVHWDYAIDHKGRTVKDWN